MSKNQLLLLSLLPAAAAAGVLIAMVLGMGAFSLMLWGLWGASLVGCLGVLAVPVGIVAFYRPSEAVADEEAPTADADQKAAPSERVEDTEAPADFDDDEDFQEYADEDIDAEELSDFDDDEDFI